MLFRLLITPMIWTLCIASSFGKTPPYQNPVLRGDYPDPSVVRVGANYWATATSSEWAPQFPILHSSDLVNWKIVGNVFDERPKWAVGNFWAPEITWHNGKFYVYYVARNREGRLSVAVATAPQATGPYTDHGPLVSQHAGSIDGMAFSDQQGGRWLVWKEDGNSRNQPTPIWLQRLTDDGLKLTGERRQILTNDAEWEAHVIEGPFVFFLDGWYYIFYAGGACCGQECGYSVGVARARKLEDPWEKYANNPILTHSQQFLCPGHGSVVQDQDHRYWFLYHAYAADTGIFTGREIMLDEVIWQNDGWPEIKPASTRSKKDVSQAGFADQFEGDKLQPGWLWPQDRVPRVKLNAGQLSLTAAKESGDELLGAVLARSCTSGDYHATAVLDLRQAEDYTRAGIAAVGDVENGIGVVVDPLNAVIWQRRGGRETFLLETAIEIRERIFLRLSATSGNQFTFAYSYEGSDWTQLGETYDGSFIPPWDRNIRIALTSGNAGGATTRFEEFNITPKEMN
jgi:beta-xylosidase